MWILCASSPIQSVRQPQTIGPTEASLVVFQEFPNEGTLSRPIKTRGRLKEAGAKLKWSGRLEEPW
jgi:hypothetical protein